MSKKLFSCQKSSCYSVAFSVSAYSTLKIALHISANRATTISSLNLLTYYYFRIRYSKNIRISDFTDISTVFLEQPCAICSQKRLLVLGGIIYIERYQ